VCERFDVLRTLDYTMCCSWLTLKIMWLFGGGGSTQNSPLMQLAHIITCFFLVACIF